MASGTFTLVAKSVDNGTTSGTTSYCGPLGSGTCYSDGNAWAFGRGAVTNNIILNYTVNDSGLFSVSYNSVSGPNWCVCSVNGYNLDIDFSVDGNNWNNIMHSFRNDWPSCGGCSAGRANNVRNIAQTLVSGLQPVVLTQSGYIRARMWTLNACPTCNGTVGVNVWPNAFPNDAASTATAVPIHIDVSWDATLNYSANGGSGAPSSQTHRQSADSYTFTVSNTVPTWTWHRFEGWATSPTATTPQYRGGEQITIRKNDPTVTLYAVWTEWYRCGDVRYSGVFKTTHRSGGKCHLRENGNWVEMRSIDAGAVTNDPPQRYYGGNWHNQYKIGSS